jgi:hypothetical protein
LKNSKWYVSILGVLFAISISLVFISGCSQNLVSSAKDDPNQQKLDWLNQVMGSGGAQLGPGLGECPVLFDTLVTRQVGSAKDRFIVKFGEEEIAFDLPKDALSNPVTLTVHATKYQAPFGSFWLLDCGPDGTVFAKPLEVNPSSQTSDNNVAVLFYYNPTAGQWEVEQIAATTDSQLLINHFSKYGISE